jgi:CBS domain-containing protein
MGRVADILNAKGSQNYSIRSESTVYDAVRTMVDHNVGALLVLDGEEVKGIITERDYLREIVLKGRTSRETLVREIMKVQVICVEPNRPVEDCMSIMSSRRIRHLPVIEEGRLVGIVSIGDIVKQRAADREVEIRYLTDYITGKYPA